MRKYTYVNDPCVAKIPTLICIAAVVLIGGIILKQFYVRRDVVREN